MVRLYSCFQGATTPSTLQKNSVTQTPPFYVSFLALKYVKQLYISPLPVDHTDEFLSYYRSTFPESTITPKLHFLEDHVVPFIQSVSGSLGLV